MAESASASLEQYVDVQLSGSEVTWTFDSMFVSDVPTTRTARPEGVRALYSSLARRYDSRPGVPSYGGGLPDDLTAT